MPFALFESDTSSFFCGSFSCIMNEWYRRSELVSIDRPGISHSRARSYYPLMPAHIRKDAATDVRTGRTNSLFKSEFVRYTDFMIQRQIKQTFLHALHFYPITIITGPRQSGKSTFLKNILKTPTYANFAEPIRGDFYLRTPNIQSLTKRNRFPTSFHIYKHK